MGSKNRSAVIDTTRPARVGKAKRALKLENAQADAVVDNIPEPVAPAEAPVAAAEVKVTRTSIRRTVYTMLAEGRTTKEIEAVLIERFPTSMAAVKAPKHIAFYRSLRKKELKAG